MVTFRSTLMPYQASVPSSWQYRQLPVAGSIADGFIDQPINGFSTNINVMAVPIDSTATTSDYANAILAQGTKQLAATGNLTPTDMTADGKSVIFVDFAYTLTEQGGLGNAVSCQTMKCMKIDARTAVFINDGTGWQITLSISDDAVPPYSDQALAEFNQMLKSFQFLQ